VFENQTTPDYSVLNLDDPGSAALESQTKARLCWFSRKQQLSGNRRGAFVRDGDVYWRADERDEKIMPVSEISLKGAHNLENVLAAVSVGRLCGCDAVSIGNAVRKFKAVEHRLEHVGTVSGVEYYNDSKATNVDATIKAIESFPGRIHLILGGKDKGSDYTLMNQLLRERVKRVYTIGAAAEKIRSHVQSAVEVLPCGTLDNAVERAHDLAKSGDIVLLAPACSSFDQFENYEHRGRTFRSLVERLATPAAAGQERR
jgi:UDP-N-acetylmuramoylalanine--D-glutamate ligase